MTKQLSHGIRCGCPASVVPSGSLVDFPYNSGLTGIFNDCGTRRNPESRTVSHYVRTQRSLNPSLRTSHPLRQHRMYIHPHTPSSLHTGPNIVCHIASHGTAPHLIRTPAPCTRKTLHIHTHGWVDSRMLHDSWFRILAPHPPAVCAFSVECSARPLYMPYDV